MASSSGKMSLIAQFDDICRYHAVLNEASQENSIESEFIKFVKYAQLARKQWLLTETSLQELKLEYDGTALELKEWKTKFDNLMKKYRDERNKRLSAEGQLIELKKIFGEVKEVVNRDNTINDQTKERFAQCVRYNLPEPINEVINEQSEFYDKTEDDLDFEDETENRSGKRRTRSSGKRKSGGGSTPPKRKKSGEIFITSGKENTVTATTTVTIPQQGEIVATSRIEANSHQNQMERCNSEPEPFIPQEVIPSAPPSVGRPFLRSESDCFSSERPRYPTSISSSSVGRKMTMQDGFSTPTGGTPLQKSNSSLPKRQLSGSRINGRQHNFVTKTVIRPEKCNPCGKRIKFYKEALKCIDCRTTCHPECQSRVGLPCVPSTNTPNKGERTTIADYAPRTAPMVPALIIYCVNEIDNRGMKEVGLYRVPGPEREVRELRERILKGKGAPNLSRVDVHVLCGVIKDFLRGFETLIPRALWHEFIKASDIEDHDDSQTALYQAISQLPQPNRDTLAYLILHFQRIAETPEVKMGLRNLATVLGPTIVGYSSATLDAASLITEQRKQCAVMEKLLNISSGYWSTFTNVETEVFTSHVTTPEGTNTPESNYGSLRSGSYSSLSQVVTKTPLSTRSNPMSRTTRGQRFFASPSLGHK